MPHTGFNPRDDVEGGWNRRAFVVAAASTIATALTGVGCGRGSVGERTPTQSRRQPDPLPQPQRPIVEQRPPLPQVEPRVRVRVMTLRRVVTDELNEDNGAGDRRDRPIRIGEKNQRLRLTQHTSPQRAAIADGPITVSLDERGWSIIDAKFFRVPLVGIEPVEIAIDTAPTPDALTLAIGERRYGGSLRLVARTEIEPGALDIVNHVAIEEYLPGVLARELFNHWHLHTHMAQAVAARSFAVAERAYWGSRRHFDMTSTQRSQAYIGAVTHRTSLDAVAQTRGVLLAEDDLVVPGYYSSCCGGAAARAVDAIGPSPINDTPALYGHSGECPCNGSPVYQWRIERGREEVTRRLIAFGTAQGHAELSKLSTLRGIEPAGINEHGRPTRYRIAGTGDQVITVTAETLRRAINYAGQGLQSPKDALRSGFFAAELHGNTMIFHGRGFGHGAGMCQYGAEALARRERDYREILAFYYPGASLVRAYA